MNLLSSIIAFLTGKPAKPPAPAPPASKPANPADLLSASIKQHIKRGTIRRDDGMVFACYRRGKLGQKQEVWVTQERYKKITDKHRRYMREYMRRKSQEGKL